MSVMGCFASGMESEIRLTGFFCLLLFDSMFDQRISDQKTEARLSVLSVQSVFPSFPRICIIPDKKAAAMFGLYEMHKRVRDYCRV